MDKKQQQENNNEQLITTDSPENYQILSVAESGRSYETTFTKKFENRKKWERPNPEEIKSFLPGTVEKIVVKKGDEVKKGSELMTYEAMKMRNIISAPFDGKVDAILIKEGDRLKKGIIMMVVKEKEISLKELKRIEKEMQEIEKKLEKKLEKKFGKKTQPVKKNK